MESKDLAPVVFLLLVVMAAAAAVAAELDRAAQMVLAEENYKRAMTLCLKGPQPRAFEVAPVLKDLGPAEVVHPWQTVLHRCDELACCVNTVYPALHCCQPQVENVTLVFYATAFTGTRRSIKHQFQNHTQCNCVGRKAGER